MSWDKRLYDADGFATIRKSEHLARKDHGPCSFCFEPIRTGQRYVVYVGMINFQFSMLKNHRHCP